MAAEILSIGNKDLQAKLAKYREEMASKVEKDSEEVSNAVQA